MAYEEAGKGPAVILLHGAFLDRHTWDLQMPALARRHRAVRYDIRPFGESSLPEQPYKTTDDLLALMDALKIDRADLVGHSFGGGVAIDFTLEHPTRVASLALVNSGVTGATLPADEQKEAMQVFMSARESELSASMVLLINRKPGISWLFVSLVRVQICAPLKGAATLAVTSGRFEPFGVGSGFVIQTLLAHEGEISNQCCRKFKNQ